MARAFPDAAIGYRWLVRSDSFVLIQRRELVRRFEAAVLLAGHSPGNALRAGDVAAALTGLRQAGWRKDFAGELVWAAHGDERVTLGLEGALDLGQKRPERHIRLHRPMGRLRDCRHLSCELTTLGSPFLPAAVHQAHVLVAVDLHLPQRPGGEPVVVVAVEVTVVSLPTPDSDINLSKASFGMMSRSTVSQSCVVRFQAMAPAM